MLLGVRDETVPNAEPAPGKRYLRLPLLADFLERAAEVVEDVANVGWCADGKDMFAPFRWRAEFDLIKKAWRSRLRGPYRHAS